MPRIPQVTPKVGVPSAPSVRQNIQAQPGAFGMGAAQALTRAGDMGQKIAAELQQRRNVVEVQNAYLAATKALDEYLHNPETGVYNRRGVNAAGSFDAVREHLPELAAEFTKNLTGAQRDLFDRQWSQSMVPALRGAMNHESREITNEKAQTIQAIVASSAERISLNFTDAQAVEEFSEITKANIMALADLMGWSPQMREAKEKEIMSKAYAATFERFFAIDDISGATAFLDKYQDQMHDAVASKLRNDLRAKAQAIHVEQQADMVSMQFEDEGEAMEYIRENYEGDVRTAITRLVQADFQTKRRVERERSNQQYYAGFEAIHGAPDRASALRIAHQEPDQEVRSKLLQVVDSKHPVREGRGGLTDEQKELLRIQKYIANQHIVTSLKPVVDADSEMYKNPANVAGLLMENGVLDERLVKDLHEYATKGGIYSTINNSRVYSAMKSMGMNTWEDIGIPNPAGRRARNDNISESDIPPELLSYVVDAVRARDGQVNDADIQNIIRKGLTNASVASETLWGRLWGSRVTVPYYQAVRDGKADQVDLERHMEPEVQQEMKAFMSATGQRVDKDAINRLARDWYSHEERELQGSQELYHFYQWAKRQTQVPYRGQDGGRRVLDLRQADTLQNPQNWAILRSRYQNRR